MYGKIDQNYSWKFYLNQPPISHLATVHSKYWLLFTTFVGLNLFQAGITKWCLMEKILQKLGVEK